MSKNSSLLQNALFVDSVISLISGVAALLFSKAIANFLGITTSWIILTFGVVAVVYSIGIFLAARAEPVHLGVARLAAYGNLVGALGIAALVFANVMPLSIAGKWTVALLADAVLVLAIFQHVGLRRLAR